jgi:hypothetical protein
MRSTPETVFDAVPALTPELAATREALHAELVTFAWRPDAAAFDALARRVVAYQIDALPAYARLAAAAGFAAGGDWRAAPLVPTELFRSLDLCSLPVSKKDRVFVTSGTTRDRGAPRGRRRVPDLTLYRTAMAAPFVAHVLGGDLVPHRWVSLIPRADVLPTSSLSLMVTELADTLAIDAVWAMDLEGLDDTLAVTALAEGPGSGDAPLVVVTTAFAMAELIDRVRRLPRLPPGSRVMLTGGFKGRETALSESELVAKLCKQFGLPPAAIVAEYGMTELTSQAYGTPFSPNAALRFRVVDPSDGRALGPGEVGLVACFDLLNLDHVSAVLTSDLGAVDADGRLTLHGRLEGASPRGCSLTAEEIVQGQTR